MKLCAAVELFLELRPAVDVERSPVTSRFSGKFKYNRMQLG